MKKFIDMTDEELALSYADGNNRAFDLLLQRNQTKLFSYILFVVHDEDFANDIFQETFVKAIVKMKEGRYASTGKFGAWLMRIAHNIIMDNFRQQHTEKIVDTKDDNNLQNLSENSVLAGNREMDFINEQILNDIKRLVCQLPTTQREVIYMHYYQQMPFKEIADATNVSINTALGRMRYAIINLRRMVREHNLMLTA